MLIFFPRTWQYLITCCCVYVPYLTEFCDFNVLNFTYYRPELSQFNNLLTNNLNKYHPFLFFLSTHVCFFLLHTLLSNNIRLNWYGSSYIVQALSRWNNTLILLIIVSLSLGGLWAFQEASWGGFWNWDSSETFGLLFCITSLYLLHRYVKIHTFSQLLTNLIYSTLILITMYCFLQLNFDLLSHNFGIKFLHLFSNSFFYKEVIGIGVILISTVWYFNWCDRQKLLFLNFSSTIRTVSNTCTSYVFWWQVLITYICIILGYSFTPLINYTLFALFQINWFNLTVDVSVFVILVFLTMIYWFTLPSKKLTTVQWIFTTLSINLLYTFMLQNYLKKKTFYVVHVLLLTTLVVNILAYKLNFLTWSLLTSNTVQLVSNTAYITNSLCLTCDAVFIEHSLFFTSTKSSFNWWVTNFLSNAVDMNQLLLLIDNLGCTSFYQLTTGYVSLVTFIVVPYTNVLLVFTLLVLLAIKWWVGLCSLRR